jgi:hypothetical protein
MEIHSIEIQWNDLLLYAERQMVPFTRKNLILVVVGFLIGNAALKGLT